MNESTCALLGVVVGFLIAQAFIEIRFRIQLKKEMKVWYAFYSKENKNEN